MDILCALSFMTSWKSFSYEMLKKDTFGESGTPEQLMKKYGLEAENIHAAVIKAINRKKREFSHS